MGFMRMSCTALWIGASGLRSSCASIARNSSLSRSASLSCCSARARSRISPCSARLASSRPDTASRSDALRLSSSRVFSACRLGCAARAGRWPRARLLIELLQLAPLAVQLHQHRHLAAQDLRHHRNRHVVDRAELVALQAVELADVHAGDEDDRRALEARMLVDQAGGLEAIHAGHVHVQQHHGEFVLPSAARAPRGRSAR